MSLMRGPVVCCLEAIDNPGVDLFKVTPPSDSELAAIPCFAWSNRGKTPMNLWLHENEGSSRPRLGKPPDKPLVAASRKGRITVRFIRFLKTCNIPERLLVL